MVLVQKPQDNIVLWIPKETQLISISVKQGTKGLQSASSKKLCGLFMSLSKPRVITVYKNWACPIALEKLKKRKAT